MTLDVILSHSLSRLDVGKARREELKPKRSPPEWWAAWQADKHAHLRTSGTAYDANTSNLYAACVSRSLPPIHPQSTFHFRYCLSRSLPRTGMYRLLTFGADPFVQERARRADSILRRVDEPGTAVRPCVHAPGQPYDRGPGNSDPRPGMRLRRQVRYVYKNTT
jgi:hypothetical protein